MRQVVRASLPLGVGTVLDPFMGGGSTVAAALAVGYESIGIESDPVFYRMAERAIAKLAELGGEAKPSAATSVRRPLHDERTPSLPFQI
jgi:site-specific DNA-methyltransferase (adenine-specific)